MPGVNPNVIYTIQMGMLIVGETVGVWGQEGYRTLNYLLNFTVNLKLL